MVPPGGVYLLQTLRINWRAHPDQAAGVPEGVEGLVLEVEAASALNVQRKIYI